VPPRLKARDVFAAPEAARAAQRHKESTEAYEDSS
jgi:hypothetical protein